MSRFIDLTNQYFGELFVKERGPDYISPKGQHLTQWWCECDCGEIKLVLRSNLISGNSTSCGHCNEIDIKIGKRYNKWVEPIEQVEDYISPKGKRFSQYKCICHYHGEGCKGYFIVVGQSLKKGLTRSCGCYRREQSSNRMTGKNNPSWKGGITNLYDQIRKASKEWSKICKERDNYTCQKCDKRGRKLHTHHIKFLFVILKESGVTILEEALKYSEFWDVSNGSTLCRKCHKKIHRLFMVGCTKEEFYIWLNN